MTADARIAAALVVALASACSEAPAARDAACEPDAGEGPVIGIADLHAHPAIELAFHSRMVWGTALEDGPANGNELPEIEPCPVETHDHDSSSPITHTVGGIVFPNLAKLGGFAHGPIGHTRGRVTDAWPNGRDVLHQQMSASSIKRAFDGGLRLMFASATDDQAVSALLVGPSFVDGFVPDAEADIVSARAQLGLIVELARENSEWMGIATTPDEARALIRCGKLALVLALEMSGLREQDVDDLRAEFPIASIIPIHLLDNDIGGTAANADLFNTGTAALSALYRHDRRAWHFIDVAPSTDYTQRLGRPSELVTLTPAPVYASLGPISYDRYEKLCYEQFPVACRGESPAVPESFLGFGQENRLGLRDAATGGDPDEPGWQRIQHLMQHQLLVDVSHMGRRAAAETLDIDATGRSDTETSYPLIASHGDIAHLCRCTASAPGCTCTDGRCEGCTDATELAAGERSIDSSVARSIGERGGVLGLGTGVGSFIYGRTLLVARGGPLVTLDRAGSSASGCVTAAAESDAACALALAPTTLSATDSATSAVHALRVHTVGAPRAMPHGASLVVRAEFRASDDDVHYEHETFVAPMTCTSSGCDVILAVPGRATTVAPCDAGPMACMSCEGLPRPVPTTTAYSVDDIESVRVEWLYGACDATCRETWGTSVLDQRCGTTWDGLHAPAWTIESADVAYAPLLDADPSWETLTTASPAVGRPLAVLDGKRGALELYDRLDRRASRIDVLASGHLLKVLVRSSPDVEPLPGAGSTRYGVDVCVALRRRVGTTCPATTPIPVGATECPGENGWVTLNQRGQWNADAELWTYVHTSGSETEICGVDIAALDWDSSTTHFAFDEVRVEAIEDPVQRFARRYAAISTFALGGLSGRLALGTDFNGLNGMFDISEFAPPPSLAPMRFREPDGTLGDEVRLDERGLAVYGLLADFVAAVGETPGCGPDVAASLADSAEATIRTWERALGSRSPSTPADEFATRTRAYACTQPRDVAP